MDGVAVALMRCESPGVAVYVQAVADIISAGKINTRIDWTPINTGQGAPIGAPAHLDIWRGISSFAGQARRREPLGGPGTGRSGRQSRRNAAANGL